MKDWKIALVLMAMAIFVVLGRVFLDRVADLRGEATAYRLLLHQVVLERDVARDELARVNAYLHPDSEFVHQTMVTHRVPDYLAAEYTRWFMAYGYQTGVSPRLLMAIAWKESRWNHLARGRAGDIGMMQVVAELWWYEFQAECGYWYFGDMRGDICYGAHAFRRYLDRFDGNVRLALAAYNAGPGNLGAGMGYARSIEHQLRRFNEADPAR